VAYFRKVFVRKVVLSTNPTSNEFTALAIYGEFEELAFCTSGDKKWTKLKVPRFGEDVMSHEGKIYVLTDRREVWISDAPSTMMRIAKDDENCVYFSAKDDENCAAPSTMCPKCVLVGANDIR
jgi:hypothetical protein